MSPAEITFATMVVVVKLIRESTTAIAAQLVRLCNALMDIPVSTRAHLFVMKTLGFVSMAENAAVMHVRVLLGTPDTVVNKHSTKIKIRKTTLLPWTQTQNLTTISADCHVKTAGDVPRGPRIWEVSMVLWSTLVT